MSDFREKEIDGLQIKIDRETCIGTRNCMKIAPEIFEFDDERIVSFKNELGTVAKDVLIEACSVCPVSALGAFNLDGGQIIS